MNEADALDIMQAAVWTVLVAAGPAVLAAMIVGVAIAFIQALTQVQEMTLTFVPKIVTIMIVLGVAAPLWARRSCFFQPRLFPYPVGLLTPVFFGCHPRASFSG